MHTSAGQGIQVGRHCGNQRFSFTGFHFGDFSLMQNNTAQQLDMERALAQDAVISLPDGRKGIRQNIIQRFSRGKPVLQNRSHAAQLVIAHGAVSIRKRLDFTRDLFRLAQLPLAMCPEHFGKKTHFTSSDCSL